MGSAAPQLRQGGESWYTETTRSGGAAMPAKTVGRHDGPSASPTTPKRNPAVPSQHTGTKTGTLQRLRSGGDAASTLQSSAVAAIGSIRTIASISSSTATSLQPIAPRRAIKVVLIGDGGCGKTSMRKRFLTNTFYPSYRATIGADFITKILPLDPSKPDGEKATLQIWDTAGQERFQSLGSAFYRGADAVIIALDATKGQEGVERVKQWYEAFMAKAPGPSDEAERKRFCWICAANKVDLLQEEDLDRAKVRQVLDGLVGRPVDQPDYGEGGATGAEEPVDPEEVLSRPDPNGVESADQSTPDYRQRAKGGEATPISLKNLRNGDALPTPANGHKSGNYRLSRKSLSSIAAAAAKSAQLGDSDADEAADANAGGTVKTLYTTPSNTLTKAQLSNSPKQSDAGGSGFLSTWRRSRNAPNHRKRQSIKSIEVFQISDQESDASERSERSERVAFPTSAAGRKNSVQQSTPPRSTFGKDRQRVDSTMSLNAPSVYHTPRSSTFFSASPTARTSLVVPSSRSGQTDDRLSVDRASGSSLHTHPNDTAKLKHKPSIASSSQLSVATVKPAHPTLKTPKSINDLFQPASPPPPATPSTISLPLDPIPPTPASVEQGFTLFYTSAKTSHNIERMFAHIVHRVTTSTAYSTQLAAHETPEQTEQRQRRQEQLVRRTIRLASGKTNDKWFGCC